MKQNSPNLYLLNLKKTAKSFFNTVPILLGVVLLIALLQTLFSPDDIVKLFKGSTIYNSIIGASIGSVSAGNPITSYVLAGEMLEMNIHLTAVIAFLVAWVSVGIVQLPAEMLMLGKKFAILRNLLSVVSSILIGYLSFVILSLC